VLAGNTKRCGDGIGEERLAGAGRPDNEAVRAGLNRETITERGKADAACGEELFKGVGLVLKNERWRGIRKG
jgi:hypothetical protein